ncbi:hypothetical protein BAJUN_00470 [Bajunvirus bajun]|uniref:DUF1937 domain-containing protein n=1 Tax=Brevundimonas phage vB_BgoS-Bajun TaxID=2948594 RepID=A0A9E7SUQ8_9CAUD|nr:hypothetical protein BAJUN_00470 [Brevundimonas phage vB_BgoS-Bajun]
MINRKPLIYLGAPYSDPDPEVVKDRMERFSATHAMLIARGDITVSPLLNHDIVGRHTIKGDWAFWQTYSENLLIRCDQLWIITLDGWQTSKGVLGEIAFARTHAIPVGTIEPAPMPKYRLTGEDMLEIDRAYVREQRALFDQED